MDYYIGQVFIEKYPYEAVMWCVDNKAYIGEIESQNNKRRFKIFEGAVSSNPIDTDKLTMTPLDFLNFLKSTGLTDRNIEDYLNEHLEEKHQLQYCQSVHCGVVKALMPIQYAGVTITAQMVEEAFKAKAEQE